MQESGECREQGEVGVGASQRVFNSRSCAHSFLQLNRVFSLFLSFSFLMSQLRSSIFPFFLSLLSSPSPSPSLPSFATGGALGAMAAAHCTSRTFPVISDAVPGGDGWLGQVCRVLFWRASRSTHALHLPLTYAPSLLFSLPLPLSSLHAPLSLAHTLDPSFSLSASFSSSRERAVLRRFRRNTGARLAVQKLAALGLSRRAPPALLFLPQGCFPLDALSFLFFVRARV